MSIWVTGSLEVRDSSDQLVFQVGDSSGEGPTKSMSTEITGSFEVVSNVDTTNYKILTASYGGDPAIARVGIGVSSFPNIALGIGGDLSLNDDNTSTRLAVVGINSYLNVGKDTNNRGFFFWEGAQKRIRIGTKEAGVEHFSSLIIKSGSLDVNNDLTVGDDLTVTGDTTTSGLQVTANSIQSSIGGTPISWDTSDNVTVGGLIQINGGGIKAPDGNISIGLGTGGDASVVNNLQVRGGEVKGATTGHLYLKSDQNIYLDLDVDGNETGRELAVRNNGSSEIFKIAESGDVTTVGDISIRNNKSITGVANVIVNYNTNGGTGNFIVERNGVDSLLIDSTGKVTISEDLQLNENRILASDGGVPISWDTSDNVGVTGTLNVGSNINAEGMTATKEDSNVTISLKRDETSAQLSGNRDILGQIRFNGEDNRNIGHFFGVIDCVTDGTFTPFTSAPGRFVFNTVTAGTTTATSAMEIDNAGNVYVAGNSLVSGSLHVGGDDIRDSGGNVAITFDGSGNTSVEGELIANGDIIKDSGDNASITFDGSGKVTIPKLQMVDTAKVRWSLSVGTTSKQLLDMGDGNGQITFTSGDDITTQYTYCYVAPCAGQFDDFAFLSECSWGSTTLTFGYNSFTLHVYKEARGTSGALSSISPSLTYSFPYNRRTQIGLPAVQSAGQTKNFQLSGGNIVTFDKGDKLWFAITPLRTTAYYSNNGTASGTQYSHFIAKFTLDTTDF